jgi:hypothetical protein
MHDALDRRPFCAEVSLATLEPHVATASRIEHWLLVEYAGHWPHEPLDAAVFVGRLREHVSDQLARLPRSRLVLLKRESGARGETVRVAYGTTRERSRRFYTLELDGHPDLLELDVASALLGESEPPGEPLAHPLLLVCTHGTRDRCCARYGQALCRAARRLSPEWAWQASHIGGDRFAGNLLVLPEGLYFGRVGPDEFVSVLREYVEGRIALESFRGASCYPMAVQAAEHHVRRETGLAGFYDLRYAGHRRSNDGWSVRILAEVAGDLHEVEVAEEVSDDAVLLTCSAERPRRPRRYAVRGHRLVS